MVCPSFFAAPDYYTQGLFACQRLFALKMRLFRHFSAVFRENAAGFSESPPLF